MNDDDALERICEYVTSLDDGERRALVRLFGALYDPRDLPTDGLAQALRNIGTLDNAEISQLAAWFQTHVNMWGVVVGDAAARERARFSQRRAAAPAQHQQPHQLGVYRKIR